MAAYNGGPGRVYNAIKKSGSRNFWDLQYYLPEESRTYVKRFIATHYIMEGTGGATTVSGDFAAVSFSSAKPKKDELTKAELAEVEKLTITGKYNSVVMAKSLSMDIVLFNHYNPNFDITLSSAGSYDLRLPPDKMELFLANKYAILNESVQVLLSDVNAPAMPMRTDYPVKRNKRGLR